MGHTFTLRGTMSPKLFLIEGQHDTSNLFFASLESNMMDHGSMWGLLTCT